MEQEETTAREQHRVDNEVDKLLVKLLIFKRHKRTLEKLYTHKENPVVPYNQGLRGCGTKNGYKHPECRNANSIGIEMCCHQDGNGRWYFDGETVERTVELVRDIMERHGIDGDHVVRHYDVTGKKCPAPYVDDGAAWSCFVYKRPTHRFGGVGLFFFGADLGSFRACLTLERRNDKIKVQ